MNSNIGLSDSLYPWRNSTKIFLRASSSWLQKKTISSRSMSLVNLAAETGIVGCFPEALNGHKKLKSTNRNKK